MAKTLYYFAVGGTGALSVEPLLHLCAAGLGPERLAIMLIDPDASNPALSRALQLIDAYQAVRTGCSNPDRGFFRTELIRTQRSETVWTPLGKTTGGGIGALTLEGFVEKPMMDGNRKIAGDVFDLLFSREQQNEKLQEGFRGNPAIGSILMHALRDASAFRELLSVARNDADARFFATGSIFGGTGASALPVLARLLVDEGVEAQRIGASVVTPYYALPEPSEEVRRDGRLKPDSARFLLAAKAALPTYVYDRSNYGTLYVIGDAQSVTHARRTYSAGGAEQLNDPHFVELFAAMAALDFAELVSHSPGLRIRYATQDGSAPGWDALTIGRKDELAAFLIAANFYLQYFGRARTAADEQRLMGELQKMPWLQAVGLNGQFVRRHAEELNALGEYFAAVWGWLAAVTENYRPLRLVSFGSPSEISLAMPASYASGRSERHLPRVDRCLDGHNVRRRASWLKRGDADTLGTLAEMFRWYNKVTEDEASGLAGVLDFMRGGSKAFVNDWYTRTAEQVVAS